MEKKAKVKSPKLLVNSNLAPLIDQYVNTNACWYLSPRSEIGVPPSQLIRAELIIEQNNQEIGRWEVKPRTYGSIVLRHLQAQQELYAIPHAKDYKYENYEQLKALEKQEWMLLLSLKSDLNKLMWARYTLDDTAGIDLQRAIAWWERAEQVEAEAAVPLVVFWKARTSVGSPFFRGHSDHLAELLAPLQVGYEGLKTFMVECPPPTVMESIATEEQTDGKGTRYKERHWYTNGEYGDGPIFHNYYCPYNELEPIAGSVNGMRIKERFYPNAPVDDYVPADDFDEVEDYPMAQEVPVREQLLQIRQLIDNLLGQLD